MPTDYKPQELAAVTALDGTDVFQVETSLSTTPDSKYITVANVRAQIVSFQSAGITSTSWDGDSFSTTAKTIIDLPAVFSGVPAGIRAVYLKCRARDSGSAGTDCSLILSPTDTAGAGLTGGPAGLANDAYARWSLWVPCDANGKIYYQIVATGASTMDIWLEVWGWIL